jgi:hypothetical protein
VSLSKNLVERKPNAGVWHDAADAIIDRMASRTGRRIQADDDTLKEAAEEYTVLG